MPSRRLRCPQLRESYVAAFVGANHDVRTAGYTTSLNQAPGNIYRTVCIARCELSNMLVTPWFLLEALLEHLKSCGFRVLEYLDHRSINKACAYYFSSATCIDPCSAGRCILKYNSFELLHPYLLATVLPRSAVQRGIKCISINRHRYHITRYGVGKPRTTQFASLHTLVYALTVLLTDAQCCVYLLLGIGLYDGI